jgi:iron complex transport system substrate-binding protein
MHLKAQLRMQSVATPTVTPHPVSLMAANRIVSLVPAATDWLLTLDLRDRLAGVTHDCPFPLKEKLFRPLTQPRVHSFWPRLGPAPSPETLVANALSQYQLNLENLRQIQPDMVIAQPMGEAHGVAHGELQAALSQWMGKSVKLVVLDPKDLEELFNQLWHLAELLNVTGAALPILERARDRIFTIKAQTDRIKAADRPTVACIAQYAPLTLAGRWIPELVEYAGGSPLLVQAAQPDRYITWNDLIVNNPDRLILAPSGTSFDNLAADFERQRIHQISDLRTLTAFRAKQLYFVDGSRYLNAPGPGIATSLEILAEILQPRLFPPSHLGKGWAQYF